MLLFVVQRFHSCRALIAILDYGFGNVRSAQRAFGRHGLVAEITSDFKECVEADGLVIPGVGAFASCMDGLEKVSAQKIINARLLAARPTLGICVGAQVLFTQGNENGALRSGLAQWPGLVFKLPAEVLPHMGWSNVEVGVGSKLFAGVEGELFYFVHSYAAQSWELPPSQSNALVVVTWSEYGAPFISAVENGTLSATQFHPEKSGDAGTTLISNWIATCR